MSHFLCTPHLCFRVLLKLSAVSEAAAASQGCSPACRMTAHWWSCMFGLLCIQTDRILSFMTDPQEPSIIPLMKTNSSAEITCSTSLPVVDTFSLHRHFRSNRQITNLFLENGKITKRITAMEYEDRLHIAPVQPKGRDLGFTLKFSFLNKEDIDVYICSWSFITPKGEQVKRSGKGTFIAPKERETPMRQCGSPTTELIFIVSSVLAFILLLFFIAALIVKCNRSKKHFRPSRVETTARPRRPPRVSVQQSSHHCSYLITSVTSFEEGDSL